MGSRGKLHRLRLRPPRASLRPGIQLSSAGRSQCSLVTNPLGATSRSSSPLVRIRHLHRSLSLPLDSLGLCPGSRLPAFDRGTYARARQSTHVADKSRARTTLSETTTPALAGRAPRHTDATPRCHTLCKEPLLLYQCPRDPGPSDHWRIMAGHGPPSEAAPCCFFVSNM